MAKGTHRVPRRTFGTVSLVLTMVMMLTVMAFAPMAGAQVERYQFTTYQLEITTVNNSATYPHSYTVSDDNPCVDPHEYSGSGYAYHEGRDEALSDFSLVGDVLSFKSLRTDNYVWYPSFTLNGDGSLTFLDGYGSDNVTAATGTWTMIQTDYNHGEYVAESVDEYGSPGAHSCIGMPIVSHKNG